MKPSEEAIIARVLVAANKPCRPLHCGHAPTPVKALMLMTPAETLESLRTPGAAEQTTTVRAHVLKALRAAQVMPYRQSKRSIASGSC
jgi:hypothetical protein